MGGKEKMNEIKEIMDSIIQDLTEKKDITLNCNEWVDQEVIDIVNMYISAYNNFDKEIERLKDLAWNSGANTLFGEVFDMKLVEKICIQYAKREKEWYDKKELFMKIVSNVPMGFQLWAGMSTNFLQLKTIYNQRKKHKLPEWRQFCEWIETLPMFKELVLKGDKNE